MKKIAVIQGPNLNLLGEREAQWYGAETLSDLHQRLEALGAEKGLALSFMQSNVEGELVSHIQGLRGHCEGLIVNAGAYTHTSIAIRDALLAVGLPFIEVHLSNVDRREEFRRRSYLSDIAAGVIYGMGGLGYELAVVGMERIVGLG